MGSRAEKSGDLGALDRGVVYGLVFEKPTSGLTATFWGGVVRVGRTTVLAGVETQDFAIAGGTHAFTASKDTYVYVDSAGTITYDELANGATKPTQDDIGAASEFLAKVVTDGTNITSVTDLRGHASHGEFEAKIVDVSFASGETGVNEIVIPYRARLVAIVTSVKATLAATDAGTVTPYIVHAGTATQVQDQGNSNANTSHAASAAIGNRKEIICNFSQMVAPGDVLRLTGAKTTAGGKVHATVVLEKL